MTAVKVPPLGESILEATVSRWLKSEGDSVAAGETIVELDTDKITVEVPALRAGVLTKQLRSEGDIVKVDEVLAEVDESARPAAARSDGAAEGEEQKPARAKQDAAKQPAAKQETAKQERAEQPPPGRTAAATATAEQKVSPAARRTADAEGVDLAAVRGTGRGGVVSKPDVIEQMTGTAGAAEKPETAAERRPPSAPARAPSAPGDGARETREKMSTRRKRIAERLLEAKQATASLTTFNEIDMTAVMRLREEWRDRVEKRHGVKLTFMPFFVKAACQALRDFPVLNAQVDGDHILYKHYVHMGIAVASDQGLIVPNIRDADSKTIVQLSADIADIARRARDGKLTMDDLTGGTFTITNGGVFGSLLSTPILNYPQVGILGLHKIQERPMVVDGKVEVRTMMYVALSYDHRIVDGQQSVQFLVRLKELMEEPAAMLIE